MAALTICGGTPQARQRGAVLLELVAALGISAIALMIAAHLLSQSNTLIARSGATVQAPLLAYTLGRIRNDLQDARAVHLPPGAASLGLWTPEPLLLETATGTQILYSFDDGNVERKAYAEDGKQIAHQVVLTSAQRWRWRRETLQLFEVEISYFRTPEDALANSSRRPTPREIATESLRIGIRGGGRSQGW